MQYGHPNCGWKLMHSNLMFGDGHDSWICVNSIHPTAEIFSNSLCWWYFQELWKKKTSTHMAFMAYFYSFIFHESFVLVFFFKAWPLARHTVDSPGFPTLLARQWRQSWTFVAAVVCKALWPCGTMPAMPASWWGSTEHRCRHMSTHFSTWDSGWLKDDSPRTMGIWSSGLPELNRTGTEWNWKLVGTSKC